MTHLIIGMGEVGRAVYQALRTQHKNVRGRDKKSPKIQRRHYDVLHVCFPYSDKFVEESRRYVKKYSPNLIIIYSTVPVNTCVQVREDAVHSPVEGPHPFLFESITRTTRWLAGEKAEEASEIWGPITGNTRWSDAAPKSTEALKLLSTATYGINLVWADYVHKIAEKFDIHPETVNEWDRDYNRLYKNLGYGDKFQRYVLDPPKGKIGGHCIVPNAELLDEQFPHEMLKMIKDMKP